MPPKLALLFGAIFVLCAIYYDRKNAVAVSRAIWWPALWYTIVASRPLGYWLMMAGIPLPGGSGDPTDGSLIDRWFFGILTGIGLWILSRRHFDWGATLKRNPWITALLVFMFVSILWSHYPFVSFKRYIKVVGSVTMAMVVLTDNHPREAFLAVLRRCIYIHLPMSIICVKYFRDIGVAWDWNGGISMWNGISTTKNVLGQVAMLSVVYFSWEIWRRWRDFRWRNPHFLFVFMGIYLLKGSDQAVSKTSIAVCIFALVVFFRLQSLKARPASVRRLAVAVFWAVIGMVALVQVHSVWMFSADSFFGKIISALGRDITLTDRIYIWHDVYAAVSNPLIGVGYGGFWIGRLANIPWNATMTWVLGQGHNGMVDTYLQLGWVGCCLLTAVLFSTVPKLLRGLEDDFDFGCFRITLFLTILLTNITESSYLRGDHHLWLIFMLIIWHVLPINNATTAPPNETNASEAEDTSDGADDADPHGARRQAFPST